MLRTRFRIHDFDEFMDTWSGFNDKLTVFKQFDVNNIVEINTFIGDKYFEIEIVINKKI